MNSFFRLSSIFVGFFLTVSGAFANVGVYGTSPATYDLDVVAKITAAAGGSLGTVVNHDAGTATPTLVELQTYQAVLVYSDGSFNDPVAMGNVLADYVDAGGRVVVAVFAWNPGDLAGRLVSGNYLPFTVSSGQSAGTLLTLVPVIVGHPLLAGVSTFNGGSSSYYGVGMTPSTGATLVANWSNNEPLVGFKGNVVGLNFYPPSSDARADFWDATTNGAALLVNALGGALPTAAPVTPVAVPTLSQWGMIVLASLLALITALTLRRRTF